jgi:hypothetical protein
MVKFRDNAKPIEAYDAKGYAEFSGSWSEYIKYLYDISPSLVSFNLIKKYNLSQILVGKY